MSCVPLLEAAEYATFLTSSLSQADKLREMKQPANRPESCRFLCCFLCCVYILSHQSLPVEQSTKLIQVFWLHTPECVVFLGGEAKALQKGFSLMLFPTHLVGKCCTKRQIFLVNVNIVQICNPHGHHLLSVLAWKQDLQCSPLALHTHAPVYPTRKSDQGHMLRLQVSSTPADWSGRFSFLALVLDIKGQNIFPPFTVDFFSSFHLPTSREHMAHILNIGSLGMLGSHGSSAIPLPSTTYQDIP